MRSLKVLKGLVVVGLFLPVLAHAVNVSKLTVQGGMIIGQASPGEKVYVGERLLEQTDSGTFVFGVGREAAPEVNLVVVDSEGNRAVHLISVKQRDYDIQRINGLPSKMVSPPAEVLERIKQDNIQVAVARKISSRLEGFLETFIWPAEGRISGVYGSQRVLNDVPKRPHYGVDVAAPIGTPVIAPASGVVTLAVPDMYYSGGTLLIDHGYGISSTFIHLDAIHVKVGDTVSQGQRIADIGATGRVTGAHLDWRINWFTERLDPELLVPPRR